MKNLAKVILSAWIPVIASAQTGPLNSFANSGASILYSSPDATTPKHIGVIGQPIASDSKAGTLVISSLMYGTDAHPPEITFDPGSLVIHSEGGNSMSINATDNDQIISSNLHYRPIGFTGEFHNAPFESSPNNQFTISVSTDWFDAMGLEYYIEVKDRQNTTRSPEGEQTYFSYTIHPEPQIPTTLLSYGRTAGNYRIISIPFLTTEPITQIFEELGPSDKSKYRIYKYEASGFKEYPGFTTVDRGKGYFIIMSDLLSDVVLQMPEFEAPHNNQSEPFVLHLTPGWNLVGNPYTLDINWSDVLNFNNSPIGVGSALKTWTEGAQYTNTQDLKAYQGAFVWLEGSQPITLQIPFKGQTGSDGGSDGRAKQNEITGTAWSIGFVLREGNAKNSQASFGMHPAAISGFDPFDDLNPPAIDRNLSISFDHPEHIQKSFVRDIVPIADQHVWQMSIPSLTSNERLLSWTIADLTAVPSDLSLYDIDRNTVIDMKKETEYTFPSDAQRFKVVLGRRDLADFHPDVVTVLPPYPNPVRHDQETTFSIGIPKSDEDFPILLALFDGVGRKVYTKTWRLGTGLHQINVPHQGEHAGNLLFYQLQIGRARYSGKLIYKP